MTTIFDLLMLKLYANEFCRFIMVAATVHDLSLGGVYPP